MNPIWHTNIFFKPKGINLFLFRLIQICTSLSYRKKNILIFIQREKWEEIKMRICTKRRDSFTIRSKGWESSLTVPRDCIILWKSNVVYRNDVSDPATLSMLLRGWYSMTAWRSCQTTTGGCSNHGVSTGALTQRLPRCRLPTKAGLLFCSKLFLQPLLLLQDKSGQYVDYLKWRINCKVNDRI